MAVDEIVKLLLGIAVAFAIFGISLQLMRLLGGLVDIVKELKRPVANVSELTDLALGDYKSIRSLLTNLSGVFSSFKEVLGSFQKITSLFKKDDEIPK